MRKEGGRERERENSSEGERKETLKTQHIVITGLNLVYVYIGVYGVIYSSELFEIVHNKNKLLGPYKKNLLLP